MDTSKRDTSDMNGANDSVKPGLETYDVVVLGGGLAGLTLAVQLRKVATSPNVLVLERSNYPVPEAAHKVGESSVEIGARYFSEVIGMKHHLETMQLRKMGLRFFFPAGGNENIEDRIEVGPAFLPAIPAYQIDRGRFENELAERATQAGAEFHSQVAVQQVALGSDLHTVTFLDRNRKEISVHCRWVVDASGRASILKRQLQIGHNNHHDVNAAWWRMGESVAIDDWSNKASWQARVPSRKRRLSTNHLMGNGYWVWLIPLASDSTSFGIVADPALHPFDEINTFERALQWLRRHEPQCARVVEQYRHKLQDFRVMKHFSHECSRVFSSDRWALTGDAGVFLDPFYSPGSDFIAFANTYITDLVDRDLRGEDIRQRLESFNSQLLSLFHNSLLFYEGQYPIMGNAQVMTVKLVWDHAVYWAALTLLYFHNKMCDLEFMRSVRSRLLRFARLNLDMQSFLRQWHALHQPSFDGRFVNLQEMKFLYNDMYSVLTANLNDKALVDQLDRNLELLGAFAGWIFKTAENSSRGFAVPAALAQRAKSRPVVPLDAEEVLLSAATAD